MSKQSWWCRHQVAGDVMIAVGFAGLDTTATLTGLSWWPGHPGTLARVMLGLQALACLSLLLRRRVPLAPMVVLGAYTLAVTFLISPAGLIVPAHPGNVWAPYATIVAAYGPLYTGRDRHRAFAALATFTIIIARPWQPSAEVITIGVLRTAAGPIVGLYFEARRRLVQALTERAERAERERHLLAEQARTEERARLAGEMHDVVTHRVSLMVLQAGALRMTAPDETTRQAAEELRAAGCQALDELRDLVGILRAPPEAQDQQSPAGGLAALVAESSAVGTPAELIEEGDPALASPVVARTAYRVVREALTNVRKHAPGAPVTVRVCYDQAQVRVRVTNARPAGPPGTVLAAHDSGLAATGSGLGLAGLRQRIELVHGTLWAGPPPEGGFCVEAMLPSYVPTAEPVS